MAAPVLQSEGAIAANTNGSLTVTLSGHQADDILILCLVFWGPNFVGNPGPIPAPSGWTEFGLQLDQSLEGFMAYFWKRAASSSETNPVCSRGTDWDTGTDTCFAGRAYTIRGCITTGNPWDEADQTPSPLTVANGAVEDVTVSGSERMVVHFFSSQDNQSAGTVSGWTAGTAATSATGTDAGFQTHRKDNISASTSADASTAAAPAQGAYIFMGVSFKPPSVAQTISGAGAIGSGEGFGSSRLNQQIRLLAIGSAEALGSVRLNQQIRPSALASLEAFGNATLTGGAVVVGPPSQITRISINRTRASISIRGG